MFSRLLITESYDGQQKIQQLKEKNYGSLLNNTFSKGENMMNH